MKKIIGILLVIMFLSSNVSFWINKCQPRPECNSPLYTWESTDFWIWSQAWQTNTEDDQDCKTPCTNGEVCSCTPNGCTCGKTENTEHTSVMGITCDEDLLVNGQCKFNINETLGIKKWETNSVGILVQDIVLSATFFIGTVVTIALIVSGLMYIFAASSGKDPANAKKWIMWSLIGLLIVVSSYIIIRLVQYIAKGF